jgi:CheY-like chemotaxis protein
VARQLSILVAEDEETDVVLLRYALKRSGITHRLVVARDGQEAIDYLSGAAPFSDRTLHPIPSLVLLDLKMPRMTGFDVLAWLQSQPKLNALPAVVLTSSPDDADRQHAHELGAAEYRVKPTNLHGLVKVMRELDARWLPVR